MSVYVYVDMYVYVYVYMYVYVYAYVYVYVYVHVLHARRNYHCHLYFENCSSAMIFKFELI